jgi:predicted acetyltransferase
MDFRIEEVADEPSKHWLRLYDGSRKAAELQVIDYEMYIAGVPVPMAGIAEVHTEAAYRRQGLMRTLFGHLDGYLRERGFPVSLLFGIPDFYHRFGYATALVNSVVRIPTRQAELARALLPARSVGEPDIPLLHQLYEQDCRGRSGPLVRRESAWTRMLRGWAWHEAPQRCAVHAEDGTLCGYAFWRPNRRRCHVDELIAADIHALESLLAVLAREAVARRVEYIHFRVPADHPVALLARRLGGIIELTLPYDAEGMLRVLDLQAVLDRVAPALAARLATIRSPSAARLVVHTPEGTATCDIGGPGGAIVECRTTLPVAGQLLMGFRDPAEAAAAGELTTDPAALPLLQTLLPAGFPYCWSYDHF